MNLKFYSKLASELCFNAAGAQASQQGPQWRICSGNHGNPSGSHSSVASHHSGSTSGGSVTAAEDAEPLDIWAVIKPGHVREKIAMFGADGRWSSGSGAVSPGVPWDKDEGLSGSFHVRKSKGNWEEKSRAKRQRHSGNQNVLWDTTFWRHLDWSPGSADGGRTETAGEREELKVSVVEMVACLEKRFCQQQQQRRLRRDAKPVLPLQKSSASLTLSRAPPTEPDGVGVSDMVARLESDGLRTQMEANGLKRTVGRVLLATAVISSSPCQPTSTMLLSLPPPASLMATPPSPDTDTPPTVSSSETPDPPSPPEEAEPPPGLLFRSPPPPETSTSAGPARSPVPGGGASKQASRAACAFLEVRQRLQQLLEPQPFLRLLPHHLLVQIFALLPTRSLAALKCSCRYFRLIIDTYGVRPADSLWVSDPCYSDDPCKQCKKRYGRGDVSLCRWHHKPFCQALPYGPGYWMCCRGVHKDTPGCNVGLHDNRWVPAFHSMNVPICRWGKQE